MTLTSPRSTHNALDNSVNCELSNSFIVVSHGRSPDINLNGTYVQEPLLLNVYGINRTLVDRRVLYHFNRTRTVQRPKGSMDLGRFLRVGCRKNGEVHWTGSVVDTSVGADERTRSQRRRLARNRSGQVITKVASTTAAR